MRFRYVAPILAVLVALGLAAALLDTKVDDGLTVWASPTLESACADFAAATHDVFKPVWFAAYKACAFRIPAVLDGLRSIPIGIVLAVAIFGLGWLALVVAGASVILPISAAKQLYQRSRSKSRD